MVVLGSAALLLILIVYLFISRGADGEIFGKFGVSSLTFTLVSSDLGRSSSGNRLTAFGITGEADAVFRSRNGNQIIVGEFKSRKYKGYVRPYEFFQTILYIGLARDHFSASKASGVIAYADGKVEIAFDQAVFDALVSMRGEMLGGLKNKKALNTVPLHKRMDVLKANRGLRLNHRPG